jgi:50S ribosomal subunit-associated GTPase HflX
VRKRSSGSLKDFPTRQQDVHREGQTNEIKGYIDGKNIGLVIFDDELTGAQISNIEKALA